MEERLEQPELDALWDFDDPVGSAERIATAAAGPHRGELVRAELQTQRARAFGLQGRFAEADALLSSLEPATGRLQVRILLERGRLLTTEGHPGEAVAVLEEAFQAARRDGDTFLAVDAAHMLAIADPARGEQWTAEAFVELHQTADPRTHRWRIALHSNRGWALLAEDEPGAALAAFERALEAAVEYGTPDQRFSASWAVGRGLRAAGRVEEALTVQRRLAQERPEDASVATEIALLTEAAPTIEP
jgi:tetratricopeptide (TPR) repeat protein